MLKRLLWVFPLLIAIGAITWVKLRLDLHLRNSVLVIAVEELGISEINCPQDLDPDARSGFFAMCAESVRFSHAFTPSVLSGPAMASLLTGTYPMQHGLRHHEDHQLPPQLNTLAQVAQRKNFRTSFFSGGTPILRKLGLHRGFENFDDQFHLKPQYLYRSFEDSLKAFWNWFDDHRLPFFTVIYANDLLFPNSSTSNWLGESRNLSFESQLAEVDEALFDLVQEMKRRDLWHSTTVVLTGLNGSRKFLRGNSYSNINLLSDRTQVALMIKPVRPKKDPTPMWNVDDNLTLADLGQTLMQYLLGEKRTTSFEGGLSENFPTMSFLPSLQSQNNETEKHRSIVIESAWPMQLGYPGIRYSIRKDNMLYIHDRKPLIYNSLLDRLETSPIFSLEKNYSHFAQESQSLMQNLKPFDLEDFFQFLTSDPQQLQIQRTFRIRSLLQKSEYTRAKAELSSDEQNLLKNNPCIFGVTQEMSTTLFRKQCDDNFAIEYMDYKEAQRQNSLSSDDKKRKLQRSLYYLQIDSLAALQFVEVDQLWSEAPPFAEKIQLAEWLLQFPDFKSLVNEIK
jgi:hypothetical protein